MALTRRIRNFGVFASCEKRGVNLFRIPCLIIFNRTFAYNEMMTGHVIFRLFDKYPRN